MTTSRKHTRGASASKVTSSRQKGRRWSHELDVIGLKFRWKRDARRALADMIAKRGSITGIRFVRELDNKYDENAIMVCLPERIQGGKQLGYLRAETAKVLAPKLDDGSLTVASVVLHHLDERDDWNSGPMVATFIDVIRK